MEYRTAFRAEWRIPVRGLRIGLSACTLVMLTWVVPQAAFALEPPRTGEIAQLKQEGKFEERLAKAKALGNDRIEPGLLEQAIYRAKREALIQRGLDPGTVLPAPPPGSKLMPTKGNVKIFALLIDFPDYPAAASTGYAGYSTQPQIDSALFGDGSLIPTNLFPYESLKNYYERSSYDQLHFSGKTLGWYRAGYTRASMGTNPTGAQREQLIKEAITYFKASDPTLDFSQFNNDTSDNTIELFTVLWTGPNNGWANFWWGYQTWFGDSTFTVDGCKFGKYIWQWSGDYGSMVPFRPYVTMHESGHGLGLPDYYDYDNTVGPNGGVGGLDMMHGNWGDHNSFSKWVLEWITPTVVATGSRTLTLNPSGTSQDAVLIMPGATSSDAFREFYIAQNRYRVGNDPAASSSNRYPTDGMLIWHVDARLNSAGTNYAWDNSYTAHKLLKLMQADGLDRIENGPPSGGAGADAAMYYNPGKVLGPLSVPSSRDYLGVDTGVNVTAISHVWPQMTATFRIDSPRVLPTLTVIQAGNGGGKVTSSDGGISGRSDPSQSYVSGIVVTLTPVAAPGSVFAGWSGGSLSGTGTRTVTVTADTTVTATFTTTLLLDEDFDPESSIPARWTTQTTAGGAAWWFSYNEYNNSGGTGECALGATYQAGPFDSELRTAAVNIAPYDSVGLEFKTSIGSSGSTAGVDVSFIGTTGPWINVWRKVGVFPGPQTVDIDLSSITAGRSNMMVRFHHYGTGVWWVLDDVKVMASITPYVPVPGDVAMALRIAAGMEPAPPTSNPAFRRLDRLRTGASIGKIDMQDVAMLSKLAQ